MQPVRPDYAGAWIGAVVPAVLGGDTSRLPEPVAGADTVLLLVLDGLGWAALQEHPERLPTLRSMSGGPITTVAPSTTSAALPSITTGLAPVEHGLVGYRIRVGGEVLNVLRWRFRRNGSPEPESVQPHPPFGGRSVPVLSRADFAASGFTRAHLRGAPYVGWRTDASLVEHVRLLMDDPPRLVYAYQDSVDKVSHAYGLRDGFYPAELSAADNLVSALLDVLPERACLLVTADHGQVHVGAEGMVSLAPIHRLVAAYAGEGRFRSLFARAGASRELVAAAEESYGGQAWVFTRERLADERWLGPRTDSRIMSRVGDVVLAAREPVAFLDPGEPKEAKLVGCHGSVTEAEMRVPLLAARGAAR